MGVEIWLSVGGLALSIVGQIFYFGSRLGKMEEKLASQEKRYSEERELQDRRHSEERRESREGQEKLLVEVRALREDFHRQAQENQDRYLRAEYADRADAKIGELWKAIDEVRRDKADRSQCSVFHSIAQTLQSGAIPQRV